MIEDKNLTEHFTLYELTKTDRPEFQEQNRDINEMQIQKLTQLARLLEHVRFVLETPLIIHSAYRCKPLNDAVGSTDRSQHLLCEAADFVPLERDLGGCFRDLWRDIKDNGANVGQLIHETANRGFTTAAWIHISLGGPWREDAKCKQILRMENGVYTLLS